MYFTRALLKSQPCPREHFLGEAFPDLQAKASKDSSQTPSSARTTREPEQLPSFWKPRRLRARSGAGSKWRGKSRTPGRSPVSGDRLLLALSLNSLFAHRFPGVCTCQVPHCSALAPSRCRSNCRVCGACHGRTRRPAAPPSRSRGPALTQPTSGQATFRGLGVAPRFWP